MAVLSKVWVCFLLGGSVSCQRHGFLYSCGFYMLSGRGFSNGLATHPVQSYWVWCVLSVIVRPWYEVLPKISENLNILRKPLALRSTARGFLLYLSTVSQPTRFFISSLVSEFCLFSLHRFHVFLLISKWRMLRNKEFALNFASSSTKL